LGPQHARMLPSTLACGCGVLLSDSGKLPHLAPSAVLVHSEAIAPNLRCNCSSHWPTNPLSCRQAGLAVQARPLVAARTQRVGTRYCCRILFWMLTLDRNPQPSESVTQPPSWPFGWRRLAGRGGVTVKPAVAPNHGLPPGRDTICACSGLL